MPNEAAEQNASLMRSITRILDMTTNDGAGLDALIPVLSLICLISILNRSQPAAPQAASAPNALNPLQKLLGDLSKGESGLGPDTLMSLLPLLNSPQLKSKLNPATISAVLGLMNNLGDKTDKNEKSDKQDKNEKQEKTEKAEQAEQVDEAKRTAPPAAAVTSIEALIQNDEALDHLQTDKKTLGRYLNWKSNF